MPQYYFIKSEMTGLVLDVENANRSPGAWVSPYPKNGTDAQKWYDDPATGTIRSKLNGFCLDVEGGRLLLNPHKSGKCDQQWERKGKTICNRQHCDMVLDICEGHKCARAKVIKYKAHGGSNQSWTFEPAGCGC